ncbi:hypothetical protein RRG08_058298 [Elysia crispata]|uniref:Uncharacterized protein n=1 Tax=Elysia crispata TaxID=231223 RepID=A0AAE0YWK6_9GAST|nr:hypothetical protein RRG08_058298 [Elysia crispata]
MRSPAWNTQCIVRTNGPSTARGSGSRAWQKRPTCSGKTRIYCSTIHVSISFRSKNQSHTQSLSFRSRSGSLIRPKDQNVEETRQ